MMALFLISTKQVKSVSLAFLKVFYSSFLLKYHNKEFFIFFKEFTENHVKIIFLVYFNTIVSNDISAISYCLGHFIGK